MSRVFPRAQRAVSGEGDVRFGPFAARDGEPVGMFAELSEIAPEREMILTPEGIVENSSVFFQREQGSPAGFDFAQVRVCHDLHGMFFKIAIRINAP